MARLGRLGAAILVLISAFVAAPGARATHCPPEHYPHPPGVPDNYPCPDDEPPDTPKPTAKPTATAPPATPTRPPVVTAAPRTSAPRQTFAPPQSTSAPSETVEATPFEIEVPDETDNPLEITVDGPIDDPTNFEVVEEAGSLSNWFFGFILGFIIGGLIGRASWGFSRRKRRQQIFG
jgi:hypothetical protein